MEPQLAIVIPAYKGRFLAQTLYSLVKQTRHSFSVYIGDDSSPDDIEKIIEPYRHEIKICYKRFSQNLGSKNLVGQWKRCIEMVHKEEWIWLLPDDDVPSANCVESLFSNIKLDFGREKLYRFQTEHVNDDNEVIAKQAQCPPLESNVDFIVKKMKFERNSSLAEYIFSKDQYYKVGGFVELPLGWGSDDLLWVRLSQKNDIVTLPEGIVRLRQGAFNISNNVQAFAFQKFDAKYLFFQKLLEDNEFMGKVDKRYSVIQFKKEITAHIFNEYRSYNFTFFNFSILKYARLNAHLSGGGLLKNIYRLVRYEFKKIYK